MVELSNSALMAVFAGLVSAATTIAVLRVDMKYLRRDVDLAHKRIDALEGKPAK